MANLEDGESTPDSKPSFSNPMDPRWSQDPNAAPPRNPYSRMPLDSPPINGDQRGHQEGFAGQNRQWQGYPQEAHPTPGYPRQGYPNHGYPVQQAKPSNVLSIVSLVAGIVALLSGGMMLVPQLGAIVCGHLALKREPHGRGMAIFGLVLGYLMLAFQIVAYLFMFVFIGGIPGL